MISNINKAKLFLFLLFFSVISVYSYYIFKNKGSVKINNNLDKETVKISSFKEEETSFLDVEYKTKTKGNKEYTTKGKQAYISKKNPDLIKLNVVHSFTKLKDGSTLNIRSEKANYDKQTKNIEYYQNVIITNKNSIIKAKSANFFPNINLIKLVEIVYKDKKNLMEGDFAELNTISNNLQIYMKNKKNRVYGKRNQE